MDTLTLYLPGFLAAYAILVVAASSPGPAVAMLLGTATAQGRGPALLAALGIATGSVIINIGTLLGVGLILAEAAWAMQLLRLLGAAYLGWLAVMAFRKAAAARAVPVLDTPRRTPWRHFAAGFLLQITNPKAVVFWLAIAAVGATAGGGVLVHALFVAGAFAISFGCHAAWALVLSAAPVRRAYGRARRGIEASLGIFFALFALRLATDRS